ASSPAAERDGHRFARQARGLRRERRADQAAAARKARAAARAAAPAAGRALDQERRQPAVPRHPHRIQERIPATAEVSRVLWRLGDCIHSTLTLPALTTLDHKAYSLRIRAFSSSG